MRLLAAERSHDTEALLLALFAPIDSGLARAGIELFRIQESVTVEVRQPDAPTVETHPSHLG